MKHCCKCNKPVLSGTITEDKKILCKECKFREALENAIVDIAENACKITAGTIDASKIVGDPNSPYLFKELCDHDKVYSNTVTCSLPPKCPWICRKCGAEGVDTLGTFPDEYTRLKEGEKCSK